MKFNLRLLYLYLFSFVGLLITVIGSIQLVDLALKTYIFRVADYTYYPEPVAIDGTKPSLNQDDLKQRNLEEQANERKRQTSNSLAMILVGVPLYLYHWHQLRADRKS